MRCESFVYIGGRLLGRMMARITIVIVSPSRSAVTALLLPLCHLFSSTARLEDESVFECVEIK